MDIKGFSDSAYNPVGTNIGSIGFSHGGVGRNAAENLANIGIPVSFLSTVDIGSSGDDIINHLNSIGVDTAYSLRTEEKGMGMWLAVLNENGELMGSISQQPDISLFVKHVDDIISELINNISAVVLEIDTSKDVSETVIAAAEKAGIPVYVIVGNMSVILENKNLLSKTSCFICNNIEAGRLCNEDLADVTTEYLLNNIENIALNNGISCMVITNGAEGAVYYDSMSNKVGHQPAVKTVVKDTTGAGDAFFSGTVGALIKGFEISKACEFGAELASEVISSSNSSVSPKINFFE